MIIYNIKSKHFTLVYNEIDEGWFAKHSGSARGYKIKVWVEADEDIPTGIHVSLGDITLRDDGELNQYIEILQDASIFAEMIQNLNPDMLKPV